MISVPRVKASSEQRVFWGLFCIWSFAWGIWSLTVPYFSDAWTYYWKLTQDISLAEAIRRAFWWGWLDGSVGFERSISFAVYGWIGFRLGTEFHHFLIAFLHLVNSYLFWVLLKKMQIPYLISLVTASIFLALPLHYEAVFWTGIMLQPDFTIFLGACFLYLRLRKEIRLAPLSVGYLVMNILLFVLLLGYPSFFQSVIMLAVLEMVLRLKEESGWRNAILSSLRNGLLLTLGPVIYFILYFLFPHYRNPLFEFNIFRGFVSVQYHYARKLFEMFSPEWILSSIVSLAENPPILLMLIVAGIVYYRFCFYNSETQSTERYRLRWLAIDFLWGYLWMISSYLIYMLDIGFAGHSRQLYIPTLGLSIMAGSIFGFCYQRSKNKKMISMSIFCLILVFAFLACGVSNHYGTPLNRFFGKEF
ncbi:MAG: hypothetical protein HY585_05285 [Candidatus Omnitrophica bacterium]|nr:hypothetical protein [Candidatus Omnitrophota bacterium]